MSQISVSLEKRTERTSAIKINVNGMAPIERDGKVKYQRLRLNAGTIATKDWDARAGRPTVSYSRRDGGALQRAIDLKCLYMHQAYLDCPVKSAEAVRERYEELLGRKRQVMRKSPYLLDIVKGWIERGERSAHTMHTYTVFARKVERFERVKGSKVNLVKSRADDLKEFLRWIQSAYDLAPNTMATQQKFTNMALNELRAEGMAVPKNIRLYGFTTPRKDVLEWEELARIIAYQPKNRTEANAQTILVALCLSAARISDTWKLLQGINRRGGVLCSEFVCTKNAERHPVTVSPIIFEPTRLILERNGMPDRISDKHIRVSIKHLLLYVGIEKAVEVHSLRRSFVSLFLALGVVPDHLLARCFTGHSMGTGSKSIFHRYNHATMALAQRSAIQLLRMVPPSQTAGLQLLSAEVCAL